MRLRVEPTLDLSTVAIAEQAHDSDLRIDALAVRAHDAQGARAIVTSEHVVLDEPEPFRAKTIEPRPSKSRQQTVQYRLSTFVACVSQDRRANRTSSGPGLRDLARVRSCNRAQDVDVNVSPRTRITSTGMRGNGCRRDPVPPGGVATQSWSR